MNAVSEVLPRISIIISTYNRAGYIGETIQSIIEQTYTNWELLIMDNGSVDNTHEVVEVFKDPRIHYHKHSPTTTGRLRNIAFDLANGNHIALMDSDDLWLPQKLEKQMNLLLANPTIHFSFTNSYDFRGQKEIVAALNPDIHGTRIANVFSEFIQHKIKPPIQSFIFNKNCLDVSGRFHEDRIFNDYRFIGNLVYHFDAAIVNEPLLLRRLHSQNSVDVYSEELAEEYIEALASFREAGMITTSLCNNLIFTTRINSGIFNVDNKHWRKGLAHFVKAWVAKPFNIIPLKKILKTGVHFLKH